jgi:hypothetical protein
MKFVVNGVPDIEPPLTHEPAGIFGPHPWWRERLSAPVKRISAPGDGGLRAGLTLREPRSPLPPTRAVAAAMSVEPSRPAQCAPPQAIAVRRHRMNPRGHGHNITLFITGTARSSCAAPCPRCPAASRCTKPGSSLSKWITSRLPSSLRAATVLASGA